MRVVRKRASGFTTTGERLIATSSSLCDRRWNGPSSVDPHYSEAFACLSQLYSNSVRYGYKGIAHNIRVLQRAIALAQRAIRISPGSSRAYFALAIAYWFDGQVDSAFDALHTSRALNPNDMEVVAELGLRYAFRADWKKVFP